jgi:hypothetical protein
MARMKQAHPTKSASKIPSKRLRASRKPEPGIKRKRRLRPGTGALRDIRRQQKTSHERHAFSKAEFRRMVRDIAFDVTGDATLRFRTSALRALQEATEDFFSQGFGFAQDMAVLARVVTPTPAMVRYALQNIMLTQGRRSAPNGAWMDTLLASGTHPEISELQRAEQKNAEAKRAADKLKRREERRALKAARREAKRAARAGEPAETVALGEAVEEDDDGN